MTGKAVFAVVESTFYEFVEDDMTEEGTEEFFRFTRNAVFESSDEHIIYVAEFEEKIVGMIDVKLNGHISLFFVDGKYQKQGIGRNLFEIAESDPQIKAGCNGKMDVNSSISAVESYEKLGFVKTKDVQTVNGIKFVPMEKSLIS